MKNSIEVPLRFAPDGATAREPRPSPDPLVYDLSEAGTQRRFDGRLKLVPRLDWSRYRCRAEIDWIWLEFKIRRETQSRWIREKLTGLLGESFVVMGPNEPHNRRRPFNEQGRRFRLKLHDPTALTVVQLQRELHRLYRLIEPVRVIGIEIALDVYSRDACEQARWKMVAALQRAHLPRHEALVHPDADLRHFYSGHPDFVIQDPRFVTSKRHMDRGRGVSDLDLEQEKARHRVLRTKGHKAPFIDSTVYRGFEPGPILFRVQNKETDQRDDDPDKLTVLEAKKRRARVEAMVLHDLASEMGFGTLDELIGFDFQALRERLFPFCLGSVAAELAGAGGVSQVTQSGEHLCKLFIESGVYGLDLYEAAEHIQCAKERGNWLTAGEEPPRMRWIPVGKNGRAKAWEKMNRRADKALERLSKRWSESCTRPRIRGGDEAIRRFAA